MYRRGIELFCEWYGKDVDTILEERKDDLTPRPNESFVDAKQRARAHRLLSVPLSTRRLSGTLHRPS